MTFSAVGFHYEPRCKLKKEKGSSEIRSHCLLSKQEASSWSQCVFIEMRLNLNYSPHKWASRWLRCMFKQQITSTPGIEGIACLLSWLKVISFQLAKLPQTSSYANNWDPVQILPLNQNPLSVEVYSTRWGQSVLFHFHHTQNIACSRAKRCRERQGKHHILLMICPHIHSLPPTDFPRGWSPVPMCPCDAASP